MKETIRKQFSDGELLIADYKQKIQYRTYRASDQGKALTVLVRFDDECGNGHCTLSITGQWGKDRKGEPLECGCIHDRIARAIPALRPILKWHLTSTDGPLHYPANPVYLAGDRDCNGYRTGEPNRWAYGFQFGNSPVTHQVKKSFWDFCQTRHGTGSFQVVAIAYEPRKGENLNFGPKYTFVGYAEKWHECPFDSQVQADEFARAFNTLNVQFVRIPTGYSTGKDRELDGARNSAVWPDATDAELSAEPAELRASLMARLPVLMAEFRTAVESLGFDYDFPAKPRTGVK